jgi:beta-glucosidase
VQESLVLLKNKNVLPINPTNHILVAGNGADNIGKQSGGWTITWQGTNNTNTDFPGGTSIYKGIAGQVKSAGGKVTLSEDGSFTTKPDVAVVVFGEEPYAEGHGDRENLDYQRGEKADLALLKKLKAQGIPVVSIFLSGRPMWVNAELNASDAFVAAWLPGAEGQGVADVILANADGSVQNDFKGKLSFTWPKSPDQAVINRFDENYAPLLPYGFGLQYGDESVLADDLNEVVKRDLSKVTTRQIFNGEMQKPWLLWLFSGDKEVEVKSSAQTLGALAYRTVDKVVQEDARQITLDGSERAGIRIASKSSFREDLRSDLEVKSALQFQIKLSEKPTGKVELSMNCEGEGDSKNSCGSSIDITKQLNAMPLNEWQSLSIDMACYANTGTIMSNLVVPFELASKGKLIVSLADIKLEPNTAAEATISCQ